MNTRLFALSTAMLLAVASSVTAEALGKPEITVELPAGHRLPGNLESFDDYLYRFEDRIQFPGADFLGLRFESFDLAPDDFVIVSDEQGVHVQTFMGTGPFESGDFWTKAVPTETLRVELFSPKATTTSTYRIVGMEVSFQSEQSIAARRAVIAAAFRDVLALDEPLDQGMATDQPKVIYGPDDRREWFQTTNQDHRNAAESVAIMRDWGGPAFTRNSDGTYRIIGNGWFDYNGIPSIPLCPDEPFRGQIELGYCSAFLVAPDLVLTAGHCVTTRRSSIVNEANNSMAFIFGMSFRSQGNINTTAIPANRVYRSDRVILHNYSSTGNDFALIRLDRSTSGSGLTPLPVRRSGEVPVNTPVVLIGHPQGIPLKIAGGATTVVRQNASTQSFFRANVDAYAGNSGSPVINANTMTVEGILVRGNADVIQRGNCWVSNRLADNHPSPEQVQKINPALLALIPEFFDGNTGELTVEPNRRLNPTEPITIRLRDFDLAQRNSVSINVLRDGQPATANSTLTLTGTGIPGFFQGTTTAATHQVGNGQVIGFRYNDERGSNGNPVTVQVNRTVDAAPPFLSDIRIIQITGHSARLEFATSEPSTHDILLGTKPGDYDRGFIGDTLRTQHSIVIGGLQPLTTYFIRIAARDEAGNIGGFNPTGSERVFTTGRPADYLTQQFVSGSVAPLANRRLRFVPQSNSVDGYLLEVHPVTSYPTPTSEQQFVDLADDQAIEISFGANRFNFFQNQYDRLFLSSNGFVTFELPDTGRLAQNHFLAPRISGMMTDLNPRQGGSQSRVFYAVLDDRFVATFDNVPFWSTRTVDRVQMQIELFFATGEIHITHLKDVVMELAGAVGISAGHGALPSGIGFSDLTSYPPSPVNEQQFFNFRSGAMGFGPFFDSGAAAASTFINNGLGISVTNANAVSYAAWARSVAGPVGTDDLYRMTIRQRSTNVDPRRNATIRFGANLDNFVIGNQLLANPTGFARTSAGMDTLDHVHYFAFGEPETLNTSTRSFIPSMQLLLDDLMRERTQSAIFESMRIERLARSSLGSAQAIREFPLSETVIEGWNFFSMAGAVPYLTPANGQGLVLQPPQPGQAPAFSHGYWFRRIPGNEFIFPEGALLEIEFLLTGTAASPVINDVSATTIAHPPVRLRIDADGFESISMTIIEPGSPATGQSLPWAGRLATYRLYYVVPRGMSGVAHNIGFEMYSLPGDGRDGTMGVRVSNVRIRSFDQP